ncbi:MAG: 16S rRNA (guanine(527)-N(7))-methyltransferase RsmG [Proteobacteria bacterium]|nr:16S rRNA (guanine(527)-N(7))-methyltransferase RsmG [Pseudomonadota bacterium]
MTPEEFGARADVSRETMARLVAYAGLLAKWNRTINLVSARSLQDPWRRHFLDSAQLYRLLPGPDAVVVDLGSGAGFPGLVLAVLGARRMHLVEADQRKAAFLREAARACGAAVQVHCARIESLMPWPADVVVARALAPLDRLLGQAAPFVGDSGQCLFLKGVGAERELTEARKKWKMQIDRIPSIADPTATILRIRGLSRVGGP